MHRIVDKFEGCTASSKFNLDGDQTRICRSLPPVYNSCESNTDNNIKCSQQIEEKNWTTWPEGVLNS